jgi:hypothetical protein
MAYTFFPTSAVEIKTTLKTGDKSKVDEIIAIFAYVKSKFPKVDSPINIDPAKLAGINISRSLQGDIELKDIKTKAKATKVSMKFGNGSSGGRGVANKGNAFEGIFANDIRQWWNGEPVTDEKSRKAIEDISETYKLRKWKSLDIKEVGELNNRRPLVFSPDVLISSQIPVSDNNLGPIVTDLTLTDGKKNIVYLSLKLGTTVTFFNVGIKTVLSPTEIKSGVIKNADGLKLLKMFNITPALFCDIYNGNLKKPLVEDVWKTMNSKQRNSLKKFLISGIGHGYHVVHKLSSEIKSTEIDKNYMEDAATPSSCMVYYGGKSGSGKRIDMEIETKKYILKLNIRDTQGGDGYPTRIMCDFSYK